MANGSANATGNQPIYLWSTMNGKFVGTGDPKDIVITGAGLYTRVALQAADAKIPMKLWSPLIPSSRLQSS